MHPLFSRSLLCVALVFGIGGVSARADIPPIMALSEVRVGMTGYGLAQLNSGPPRKFFFEVLAVEDAGTIQAGVRIKVFRTLKDRRPFPGSIVSGMSGSPVFIGGRLIGAVAAVPVFAKDGQGYVTPVESMLQMPITPRPDVLLYAIESPSSWVAGQSYSYCQVWGTLRQCSSSTVTFVDSERHLAYAQGHSSERDRQDTDPQSPYYDLGPVAWPVFKTTVRGVLPRQDVGSVIVEHDSDPIGTVIYNGRFGHVIRTDVVPEAISASIQVVGFTEQPVTMALNTVFSDQLPLTIQSQLDDIAKLYAGTTQATDLDMEMKVRGIETPFRMRSMFTNYASHDGEHPLQALLSWLMLWTKPRPDIASLSFTIRRSTHETYHMRTMNATVKEGGVLEVAVVLRRERDWRSFTRTFTVATGGDVSNIYLGTGTSLQRMAFTGAPAEHAAEVLNAAPDTQVLYLARVTMVPAETVSGQGPDGWTPAPQRMSITVLGALGDDSTPIAPSSDDKMQLLNFE